MFKVIGQLLATGLIQKNKEQPFFETLAQKTGLPIVFDYKPIDTLGVKDTEQLRMMKSGRFEIVSLRVSQNSRDEPMLLGLDLVGQNPDYATGRQSAKAWSSRSTSACRSSSASSSWASGRSDRRRCSARSRSSSSPTSRDSGPRQRREPREVHLLARGTLVALSFPDPPTAVARRGRLRDHRRELGHLGRLARGVDASAVDRLPGGAQRLRDHAESWTSSSPTSRPATGRVRRADRGRVEYPRSCPRRVNSNIGRDRARPGRSRPRRRAGDQGGHRAGQGRGPRYLAAGLGRGLRREQSRRSQKWKATVGNAIGVKDFHPDTGGPVMTACKDSWLGPLCDLRRAVGRGECRDARPQVFNYSIQGADELGGYALAAGLGDRLLARADRPQRHPRRRVPRALPRRMQGG